MSKVLDLISELGALSDTKIRLGGNLPPPDEERLGELRTFFDMLMTQTGLPVEGDAPSLSADQIRRHFTDWNRLRVPANACAVLLHEDRCHRARIVNLSRGGAFVASESLLPVGSRPTVYVSGMSGGSEDEVLELTGEVTWCVEKEFPQAELPRGMGLRFLDIPDETRHKLDFLVVAAIEKQLARLW
jgi:hypothetical protein